MPELPEVETIVRGLRPALTGRRILSLEVRRPGSVRHGLAPDALVRTLPGRTILAVRRRAKLAVLDLDGGLHLVFHLKMTGRLHLPGPEEAPDKHTHLTFTFEQDRNRSQDRLFFRDARTFGYCAALDDAALGVTAMDVASQAAWPFWRSLGPEPLETSPEILAARLEGRRGRIKALLLDQTVLAGVGNIYADEALFRARIHPAAPADALSREQREELMRQVQAVLQQGIDCCGASIRDYVNAHGDAGAFQACFQAYGRGGQPCVACGQPLRKITVAGRASVHCPACQPLP